MRVLALDIATKLGFAVFEGRDDPRPRFGTFLLPKVLDKDDIGTRTLALRRWLRDQIAVLQPGLVAFEAPWVPRVGSEGKMLIDPSIVRLLVSLAGEAETTAKECGVRVMEVASSSAKIALAGTARLGKDRKKLMVIAATRRGWRVSDDHQADAGAVALVVYDCLEGA